MAFAELSSDGTSNSTTAVELVAAPGASTKRVIKLITVHNTDDAAATVTITFDNNTNERIISKLTLAVGDQLYLDDVIVLSTTTDSINLVLAGAVNATQLDWTAHYGDVT